QTCSGILFACDEEPPAFRIVAQALCVVLPTQRRLMDLDLPSSVGPIRKFEDASLTAQYKNAISDVLDPFVVARVSESTARFDGARLWIQNEYDSFFVLHGGQATVGQGGQSGDFSQFGSKREGHCRRREAVG